ncbi:MAG: helix-turn-helix domain-containing protein [Candidatus Altiarchaeota archaeon]|nr:helix-turn-helix domain-containing protein [Candidatus Altiarchaeota archaeon]
MNRKELEKLIQSDEGTRLEFKRQRIDNLRLARSMASFANTGGGLIMVGVDNKKKIYEERLRGVSDSRTDKLNLQVGNVASDLIKPRLKPRIEHRTLGNKNLILIHIKKARNTFYLVKGVYYYRIGAQIRSVEDPGELKRILSDNGLIEWDKETVQEAGYGDLDDGRIKWYLEKRAETRGIELPKIPLKQTLINLGVIIKRNNGLIPTNAGILFFGKKPQGFIPSSELKIARFKGTGMVEFIDRVELHGILPKLIDEAEKFVKRNTRRATKVVGFDQINVTEYPYEAIREAITNAIAHRDYLFSGASIRVMVFDDRIEVESPGSLPVGVTLKTLEGSHVLRNKLLAGLLYDLGYIEKWGTGIRRMKDLMVRHGLPEPEFEETDGFFRVTFRGPGDEILDLIKPRDRIDLRELGLNERQIKALRLMVNEGKRLTNKKYRELFHVSKVTAFRDLTQLVDEGLINESGKGRSLCYLCLK